MSEPIWPPILVINGCRIDYRRKRGWRITFTLAGEQRSLTPESNPFWLDDTRTRPKEI